MGEPTHDGLAIPGRVVLAHETTIKLGGASIRPSTREIEYNGTRETLEPRIMQVLVVLARAGGKVVGREELIQLCWDGRAVGDDAINRVIWRLRHILDELCPEQLRLETIPRVGYRLVIAQEGHGAAQEPRAPQDHIAPSSRRSIIGASLAVGAALMTGAYVWSGSEPPTPPSPEAERYFERGLQLRGQNSLAQAEQAIAYFREATRLDPEYAEAWGALAWGYRGLFELGPQPDAQRLAVYAQSAAERALQLDRSNADAKLTLLLIEPVYGRWEQVEQGCRQVLADHPEHIIAEYQLANVLGETGRWTAAIEPLRRVAQREPFMPLLQWRLADSLMNAERYDEAGEELASALRIWPGRQDLWKLQVTYLLVSGRANEALNFINNAAGQPADSDLLVNNTRAVAEALVSGSPGKHRAARQALIDAAQPDAKFLCLLAPSCALIGELDMAMELFEAYFFNRGAWRKGPVRDRYTFPLFKAETKSLRSHPGFAGLLREIGLEGYWRSSGNLPDYLRRD